MSGTTEVFSNVSKSIAKIHELHWETGNEVNSKNAAEIMKQTRVALSSKTTRWQTIYDNGKKKFIKGAPRPIGQRVGYGGQPLKTELQNLIQFRTYTTTGTAIVAGMMKSGTTEIREDGKVVSRKRVDGVSKQSIAILQKLNDGKQGTTMWQDFKSKKLSSESLSSFEGKWKALKYIEEGRRNSMEKINTNIKQGFKDALQRREKYANMKAERVS